MNALKNPSFLRPSSRSTSPAPQPPSRPDSGIGFERVSRPLNKLSFSNFRRQSPAPSPAPQLPAPPLIHDGSYLEILGLKLSEAVSRALHQPTASAAVTDQIGGKKPIPAGRGSALGALIASEFNASADNAHLRRAIVRSLHRPLSVLTNSLSTSLASLLSSASFRAVPTIHAPNPTPAQLHALGISTFAGELLETFDDLGLGLEVSELRGDGLKVIRDQLTSIIARVVNPLFASIRHELEPLVESLEIPSPEIDASRITSNMKSSAPLHPSISTMTVIMPIYARALSKYSQAGAPQKLLASFIISLAWKGIVALSARPFTPLPSSPTQNSTILGKKRRGSPSSSPPRTPPVGRFTIKLPPSRPPSPPSPLRRSLVSVDARALADLLKLLPRPTTKTKVDQLGNEAACDALRGVEDLPLLLAKVEIPSKDLPQLNVTELVELTENLPTLIALSVILNLCAEGSSTVSDLSGLSEEEYRKGCLSGFARAEECGPIIGPRVLHELKRRLALFPNLVLVVSWLELELAAISD